MKGDRDDYSCQLDISRIERESEMTLFKNYSGFKDRMGNK